MSEDNIEQPVAQTRSRKTPLVASAKQQTSADNLRVVKVRLGDAFYAVDLAYQDSLYKTYPSAELFLKWRAENRSKYALTGAASFLHPSMFGFLADTGTSPLSIERKQGSVEWPAADIHSGVLVVIGETGAGKTTYLDREMSDKPEYIIRLGEPIEEVDYETGRAIRAYNLADAVELAIMLARYGHKVAIDGMRPLVYASDGAALKGGISSALFDSLTSLNNLCADSGVTIIITLNPMLDEDTQILSLYKKVSASTAGAVLIQNQAVTESQLRITRAPFRVNGTLAGQFSNGGEDRSSKGRKRVTGAADLGDPSQSSDDPYYKVGLGLPGYPDDDDSSSQPRTLNINL
jgi:hypothetical protein